MFLTTTSKQNQNLGDISNEWQPVPTRGRAGLLPVATASPYLEIGILEIAPGIWLAFWPIGLLMSIRRGFIQDR